MLKVWPLINEYRAEAEAKQKVLHKKVAAENAQISAKSALIFHVASCSKKLQQEYDQASSSIAADEMVVARVEVELMRVHQALVDCHHHQ